MARENSRGPEDQPERQMDRETQTEREEWTVEMTEGQGQEETEVQGTENFSSSAWRGGAFLPAPGPYCHILQGLHLGLKIRRPQKLPTWPPALPRAAGAGSGSPGSAQGEMRPESREEGTAQRALPPTSVRTCQLNRCGRRSLGPGALCSPRINPVISGAVPHARQILCPSRLQARELRPSRLMVLGQEEVPMATPLGVRPQPQSPHVWSSGLICRRGQACPLPTVFLPPRKLTKLPFGLLEIKPRKCGEPSGKATQLP